MDTVSKTWDAKFRKCCQTCEFGRNSNHPRLVPGISPPHSLPSPGRTPQERQQENRGFSHAKPVVLPAKMQTYAITNNHGVSQTETGDRPPVNMTENEKSPCLARKCSKHGWRMVRCQLRLSRCISAHPRWLIICTACWLYPWLIPPLLLDVVPNAFNLDAFLESELLVVSYSMLLLAGDCSIVWTHIPNYMHTQDSIWLDPRLGEKKKTLFLLLWPIPWLVLNPKKKPSNFSPSLPPMSGTG